MRLDKGPIVRLVEVYRRPNDLESVPIWALASSLPEAREAVLWGVAIPSPALHRVTASKLPLRSQLTGHAAPAPGYRRRPACRSRHPGETCVWRLSRRGAVTTVEDTGAPEGHETSAGAPG